MKISYSNNNIFSKKHTKVAKGLAILLMVFHHLFVIPERLHGDYYSIVICDINVDLLIANFAKICVAIFLFLSGLGLYYSFRNETSIGKMYKKVLRKLFVFFINFWVIAIFVFPIGLLRGFFKFNLHTIIGVITGSYSGVWEWWFVNQYIVLMLISPLLFMVLNNNKVHKRLLFASLLFLVFAIAYTMQQFQIDNFFYILLNSFVSRLVNINCVLVFIIGVIWAKYNLYSFFVFKSKKITILINFLTLLSTIAIRLLLNRSPGSMRFDYIIVPFFVCSFVSIVDFFPIVKTTLFFFSIHSTNIWLTHTFWCYYYFQDIVLLPKFSILIYFWLLFLSVLTSVFFNIILYFVNKNFFQKRITIIADGLL